MNIENYISSGIIELYVMGLCNAGEKEEVEQLRRQHPALNQAILAFEISLEKNSLKNTLLPGAAVDDSILQSLHSLQSPVVSINTITQKNKAAGYGWLKALAAAAVLLLGISTIFNYTLYNKNKKQELALKNTAPATLPVSDYNILKDPAITPVAMYGVGYHTICRCTLFWDKKTGKAYIMIHHLPRSSDKRDYQLWATVNGKPVNIGIIDDAIRDRFIEMSNVPVGAVAFSVTLENAGGASAPTVEETYVEGKI